MYWPVPPRERIGRVEQKGRLARDVGRAGDSRDDLVPLPPVLGAEQAADDAFLHPLGPDRQFAIGREARDLGASPGTAGRPVVGVAGTEDKVPAAGAGLGAGTEERHVIHLGATPVQMLPIALRSKPHLIVAVSGFE